MITSPHVNLALVLSGGGARGAYEAGVMHYIRTMLPTEIAHKRRFDILCGSSVGAINTCLLASLSHDLQLQGQRIYHAWKNLDQSNVYQRDASTLAGFLGRSFVGIMSNIFSSTTKRQQRKASKHFQGLLDTSPMIPFLKDKISWHQISTNISNHLIKAVSVTATNVYTGKLELFVEKHPSVNYTGQYVFHDVKLEYIHAIASSALPVVFPAVLIKNQYYIDGSLRLNTPMSPAIQLGADRIMVVGLHYKGEGPEDLVPDTEQRKALSPPSMGLLLGKILAALFLDRLDYDIEQMTRINRIIEWADGCYNEDFISKVNQYLLDQSIKGDIANRGLKRLSAFEIYPSRDIRDVFLDCVETQKFSANLSSFEKFLMKILDVDVYSGKDVLSFLMFHPAYIEKLLELGFEDARSKHDEIVKFMSAT